MSTDAADRDPAAGPAPDADPPADADADATGRSHSPTVAWLLAGAALAVLWVFVNGPAVGEHPLRTLVGVLLTGLVVALPVAYTTRALYGGHFPTAGLAAVVPAVLYIGTFLRELLTANVDVAYRVLAPSMPIDPQVVAVPLRVESDAAITTIANSLTLTPGTLTMDYDADTNILYVHTLTGRGSYDQVVAPIRAWEDYALVIFDERLDPDDPAPDRPTRPAPGSGTDPDRGGARGDGDD